MYNKKHKINVMISNKKVLCVRADEFHYNKVRAILRGEGDTIRTYKYIKKIEEHIEIV